MTNAGVIYLMHTGAAMSLTASLTDAGADATVRRRPAFALAYGGGTRPENLPWRLGYPAQGPDPERLRQHADPALALAQLGAVVDRLDAFERHYNQIAKPIEWSFTRRDLAALIDRVADHEPRLRLAA